MDTAFAKRYRLQEQLGVGGMGEVYRATDRLTGQAVALKRVFWKANPDPASTPNLRADESQLALAHEFETLASLRHPHIIEVIDYGFDDERRPYFTMTLLPSAQNILHAAGNLPLEEQVAKVIQILEGLTYLHRRGVVHRDLKPENILVEGGQVKLVDFGLSALQGEGEPLAGTISYIAPEVLKGGAPTPAADLYAVGLILYQLLEKRYPYPSGELIHLVQNILMIQPTFSDTSNPRLAAVQAACLCLLEKDPARRYRHASAAIDALAAAIETAPPPETSATRESFIKAARFIGREAELAQMVEAIEGLVTTQRGGVWLVGGESGIGKSRLVQEVAIRARVLGVTVLSGHGVSDGGLPMQVWREPLRRLALMLPLSPLQAAICKQLVPDLGPLLGIRIPDAPPADPPTAKQRLIGTLQALLHSLTTPTLIVLEDLQWAAESLELVQAIAPLVETTPLMLVGTYRNDERPDLPSLFPSATRIDLPRLPAEQIAALGVSMIGEAGQHPAVVELLQRETEGNVFFLTEVINVLAESTGSLSAIGSRTLPAHVFAGGIAQLVQRRLARIPAHDRDLLALAAVAGRQLDPLLLRVAHPSLDAWLTTCANAAVIEPHAGQWRFSHDKIREAVLAELSPPRKADLHRRIAQGLQQVYGASAEPSQLAYHWHAAGDLPRAHAFALEAGNLAYQTGAFHAAALHYQQAWEWLDPAAPLDQRLTVGLDRLLPLVELGHSDEALDIVQALDALAPTDAQARHRLHFAYGRIYEARGDFPQATHYLEQALASASTPRDLCRVQNALGNVAYAVGDYAAARVHLEASLALAEQHSVPIRANILSTLSNVARSTGAFAEAEALALDGLALRREMGDIGGITRSLIALGSIAIGTDQYARAKEYLHEALAMTRTTGQRNLEGYALSNLGMIAQEEGVLGEAQTYSEQALALRRAVHDQRGIIFSLLNLGDIAVQNRVTSRATTYYREALELAWARGIIALTVDALGGLAQVYATTEREMEAAAILTRVLSEAALDVDSRTKLTALQDDLQARGFVFTETMPSDLGVVVAQVLESSG